MLSYFHSFIDLGLFVAFMGAFGIFTNKRHILLSVICIEMMFYGVNFFLVALSVYLDDIIGELFALFVLTLAAAESALALALITVYFRVYGNVLFSEELFSFYMQSLHFSKYLKNIIPSILYSVHGKEVIIYVSSNNLIKLITFLKKHTTSQMEQLIDLTAVDYPSRKLRFEVIYQFLSITYNQRITISTSVNEGNSLDSITSLYSSAG
jgi:NADH:ubiquinone oxidoreductase subunit K